MENPHIVKRLFTSDVLQKLEAVNRPPAPREDHAAEPMRQRHIIFSDTDLVYESLRARRVAWWAYVDCAARLGLLDNDLCARLTDTDDGNFRGALAECMVIWFLTEHLRLPVRRNTGPGGERRADFNLGDTRIEIKAPYVPVPGAIFGGDDSAILRRCVSDAGKQLKKGVVNIITIAPMLRTPVWMDRDQLVKAIIGERAWSVHVSLDPDVPSRPVTDVFLQKGKLAKLFATDDGGVRTDLTRVSAVMTVEEETMATDQGVELRRYVHVVHNPFATNPLSHETFASYPQLVVLDEGRMGWTDKRLAS